MYSGLQNGFFDFENLLIAEFFNYNNEIHSNLHSQISNVVVFTDHDGTMPAKKFWPSLSVNSKKKIVIRTLLSS
jgi:hypothetical protein